MGRQVRAKIEQLRWQCFKEEQQMPIFGVQVAQGWLCGQLGLESNMFSPDKPGRGSRDSKGTRKSR